MQKEEEDWTPVLSRFHRTPRNDFNSRGAQENEDKILIKKLQEKNKILEERVLRFEARIKILEDQLKDLHRSNSRANEVVITSSNLTNRSEVVGTGNRMFSRWMNSREENKSLWADKALCNPLISYIGSIYGQKNHIYRILEPLRIQFNQSDELDQLHAIIKQLEKQPGAMNSLDAWRKKRSNRRSDELKIIFEYETISSTILTEWKIDIAPNLTKIIDPKGINGYFDLICRDGETTAEIGQYLNLTKENIFGGNDYDSNNDKITFAKINLNQSTIELADNCIDLITCFVTLHHVPHLNPMLLELTRILRPGGFLILREHDCKKAYSLRMKYLNFIHAFMMIVRIDEFAHVSQAQNESTDWKQLKAEIINYTSSIQYHSRDEWKTMLENIGFQWKATLEYASSRNPQALYYSIFQFKQ